MDVDKNPSQLNFNPMGVDPTAFVSNWFVGGVMMQHLQKHAPETHDFLCSFPSCDVGVCLAGQTTCVPEFWSELCEFEEAGRTTEVVTWLRNLSLLNEYIQSHLEYNRRLPSSFLPRKYHFPNIDNKIEPYILDKDVYSSPLSHLSGFLRNQAFSVYFVKNGEVKHEMRYRIVGMTSRYTSATERFNHRFQPPTTAEIPSSLLRFVTSFFPKVCARYRPYFFIWICPTLGDNIKGNHFNFLDPSPYNWLPSLGPTVAEDYFTCTDLAFTCKYVLNISGAAFEDANNSGNIYKIISRFLFTFVDNEIPLLKEHSLHTLFEISQFTNYSDVTLRAKYIELVLTSSHCLNNSRTILTPFTCLALYQPLFEWLTTSVTWCNPDNEVPVYVFDSLLKLTTDSLLDEWHECENFLTRAHHELFARLMEKLVRFTICYCCMFSNALRSDVWQQWVTHCRIPRWDDSLPHFEDQQQFLDAIEDEVEDGSFIERIMTHILLSRSIESFRMTLFKNLLQTDLPVVDKVMPHFHSLGFSFHNVFNNFQIASLSWSKFGKHRRMLEKYFLITPQQRWLCDPEMKGREYDPDIAERLMRPN
jgi:hypothetical protein